MRRQIERDDREGNKDNQPAEVGDDEGNDAIKDCREVDVANYALDDEHDHAHRGMDQPKLHRHDNDDAEPDRVEAKLLDDRKDDRHGQDDHGERIHQAAEHDVHDHDQRQYAVAADAEP